MHNPRSSLAIALVDYKGPRPGIALTIAAVALLAGLVVGVVHVYALGRSGVDIRQGKRTIRALHSYNAALEVWRQMAFVPDTAARHAVLVTQRDSIANALREELTALGNELRHPTDQSLVYDVLQELNQNRALGAEIGEGGRAAMIILMARQDSALFRAAARFQRSQFTAALIIALSVIAAGVLIIPMSFLYIRYKRGIPLGV